MNYLCIINPVIVAVLFAVTITLSFPSLAMADSVVRYSRAVSIAVDQEVFEDAYLFGNSAVVSGTVKGDVVTAATTVTQNGSVEGDLLVVAARAQLYGPVGDDMRIIAGEVEIGDEVVGDIFVIAGTLNLLSTAKVKGDIFFFGGSATLDGNVEGSVHGSYTTLRIDGAVGGDVDVKISEKLVLGDKANVKGNVQYASVDNLVRATDATVEGSVVKSAVTTDIEDGGYRQTLIAFLIALFSALTVYVIARNRLSRFISSSCQPFLQRLLLGLLVIVVIPFVSALLMVTVLGFWLGLGLLAVWLLMLVMAYVGSPILLGTLVWKYFGGGKIVVNTLTVCFGAVLLFAMLSIPYVGVLLILTLMGIVVGGLTMAGYSHLR